MGTRAGVGISHHRNPTVAGREAAQRALAAGLIDQADFVFMFAAVGYDQLSLVQAVRVATGNAPLCGCSGEGVIAEGEADESNFSVAVMAIASDELRFTNGVTISLRTRFGGCRLARGCGCDPARVCRTTPWDSFCSCGRNDRQL